MKKYLIILLLSSIAWSQNANDENFKKRVLESTELDVLTSFYTQDGNNASVNGGIGSEKLNDYATDINVSVPLNDDDVLTINATISAYTSASSSNLNPWSGASSGDDDDDDDNNSGASRSYNKGNSQAKDDDDDDDDDDYDDDDDNRGSGKNTGTPWAASSGASRKDTWVSGNIGYSHSSDSRNSIYSANVTFANEYDYASIGGGLGFTQLFNDKNTEINLHVSGYFDQWRPEYPTEIKTYVQENGNLNADFFNGVDILNSSGIAINKFDNSAWQPIQDKLIEDTSRNSYTLSLGFSQILTKTSQLSISTDLIYQEGWLANPMQRVYFSDKANFFIGDANDIPNYNSPSNKGVYQLADDIERMPGTRLKFPIGVRFNQYLTENFVLRTFYRYYFDDWGINSNTFQVEMACKVNKKLTLYPSYRFYTQTQADYFAPFDQLSSQSQFYTSDYDLSAYDASQFGFALKYTDIFASWHLGSFGLKNLTLNYSYYDRNINFNSHIVSIGTKFILDK